MYGDGVDDDTPWEPPLAGSEVEHLLGALDRLRTTFRWKADGLDDDHASTMCLDGTPIGEPWTSTWQDDDWVFDSADHEDADALYALWDGAVARARERFAAAIEAGGPEQLVNIRWPDGRQASLRRLLFDLVEEYGRHTGHADLLREAIDGRVGEDPPAGWTPVSPYR